MSFGIKRNTKSSPAKSILNRLVLYKHTESLTLGPLPFVRELEVHENHWHVLGTYLGFLDSGMQEHIGLQGIVKGGLTGGEDKEWWGWGMGQKLKKEEWGEELF